MNEAACDLETEDNKVLKLRMHNLILLTLK